jgi:hypothetical protein
VGGGGGGRLCVHVRLGLFVPVWAWLDLGVGVDVGEVGESAYRRVLISKAGSIGCLVLLARLGEPQ